MTQTVISPETTRELQNVSLRMLLFFRDFCERHGLVWYFCGGCCIGTVRTGGFIPWDDDVDVFMPREDYERLKQIWQDTDAYSIQYTTREKQTANQFLTICANDTTFIKTYQKELDINHGVMLDVLPLDGCPHGFRRKLQKMHALLYALFIVGKAPENHGALVRGAGKVLLRMVHSDEARYRAWRRHEKKMTRYRIADCDFITELCAGPHYMKNEYPKACFGEPVKMRFEGYDMNMPSDYDTYLRMAFGDYMQLPPEEKRVCHHEYEMIDLKHSYLRYRGKYYAQG